MTSQFFRSAGLTASEQVLRDLCSRTFLSLWSYANVYRDQGRGSAGDGKELCDLLVVFGDDVLIFSDKACAYPSTGDSKRDWARWYRRAIGKSAKQVLGAERWLREHPHRVFLDPSCTVRLPIALPTQPRFHRILVATGAREACAAAHGGTGSFGLRPEVVGDEHEAVTAEPFVIGRPDADHVLHVFDDLTVFAVLRQLDTVVDFVAYLNAKEQLIRSGRLAFAPDELCLLAIYLGHVDAEGRHSFPGAPGTSIMVDAEAWNDFLAHPNVRRKQFADGPSYLWDGLIESFAGNLEKGALIGARANEVTYSEQLLRQMASSSRVERRHLGQAILDVRRMVAERGKNFGARTIARGNPPTDVFVLAAVENLKDEDYEAYRRFRTTVLQAHAHVTKKRFPSAQRILGVAFEPEGAEGGSEDAILFEPGTWSDEEFERARDIAEKLNLAESPIGYRMTDWEFPRQVAASPTERRKARNRAKRERRAARGK